MRIQKLNGRRGIVKKNIKIKCSALHVWTYFIVIAFIAVVCSFLRNIYTFPYQEKSQKTSQQAEKQQYLPQPQKCSEQELLQIRKQLPPHHCVQQDIANNPWKQKCSITAATKCPNATWLETYYREMMSSVHSSRNDAEVGHAKKQNYFLGLSVGCNKGFDALATLRMGTFDSGLKKKDWRDAMNEEAEIHKGVCGQDKTDEFVLPAENNYVQKGEMHCIEPMTPTYEQLFKAATKLGYNQKGFIVTHAAVSKNDGTLLFPKGTGLKAGVENKGLSNCKKKNDPNCHVVDVYTLQTYIRKFVEQSSLPINILSIDVEGFDFDVLLGAGDFVINNTEYLEFEYNWMGSWKEQHLFDAVKYLNQHEFTCYWAGIDRLWRITNCWMVYYDIGTWSNIACVSRSLVPLLAKKMESIFQKTLLETDEVWTKDERIKSEMTQMEQQKDSTLWKHVGMSTNPSLMTLPKMSDAKL